MKVVDANPKIWDASLKTRLKVNRIEGELACACVTCVNHVSDWTPAGPLSIQARRLVLSSRFIDNILVSSPMK